MITALAASLLLPPAAFNFKGVFVEGCSCKTACSFEMTGKIPGCNGAGFFTFERGTYGGRSLAGGKVAFVAGSTGWVRLYFDGPTQAVRQASRDFITSALADWGKPESIQWAPIQVVSRNAYYVAQIADGRVLDLQTEPATPALTHKGIFNSKLHPEIMQASTLKCTFRDGARKLSFAQSNAFFHPSVKAMGKT
jgi:hypothetical protein